MSKKIVLCCVGGMSTSILQKKLQDYLINNNLDVEVSAMAVEELPKKIEEVDLILLGPQVRYKEEQVKTLSQKYSKPYDIIPFTLYGQVDVENIYKTLIVDKI